MVDMRGMVGWFGVLLAGASVLVGLVAIYAGLMTSGMVGGSRMNGNLLFLAASTFLGPLGLAGMAAGATGLVWPTNIPGDGHGWRCWTSLGAGTLATLISFFYGAPW